MSLNVSKAVVVADANDIVNVTAAFNGEPALALYSHFVQQLVKDMGSPTLDLLHAAVGISGEAGELLDAVKKNWAYGKPLDRANVIEELGDLEFYCCAMRMLAGVTRQEVLQANADKLAVRYGNSYSDAAAIARADKSVEEHIPPSTSATALYRSSKTNDLL